MAFCVSACINHYDILNLSHELCTAGALLLTWFNFNPSMDE